MALKVADIAHLSAPTEEHKRWTESLSEEFFLQGDSTLPLYAPMSLEDSIAMVLLLQVTVIANCCLHSNAQMGRRRCHDP